MELNGNKQYDLNYFIIGDQVRIANDNCLRARELGIITAIDSSDNTINIALDEGFEWINVNRVIPIHEKIPFNNMTAEERKKCIKDIVGKLYKDPYLYLKF